MEPAFNVGDVIIAGPLGSDDIKPGVIVTYAMGKTLITHRVLSVDGNTLITKGDANKPPTLTPSCSLKYKAAICSGCHMSAMLPVSCEPGWAGCC